MHCLYKRYIRRTIENDKEFVQIQTLTANIVQVANDGMALNR